MTIRYKDDPDYPDGRPYYRCDNCGKEYGFHTDLEQIGSFWERHDPGNMVAAGECLDEECGGLVFRIEDLDRIDWTTAGLTEIAGELQKQGHLITADALIKAVQVYNQRISKRAAWARGGVATPDFQPPERKAA